MDRAEENRTPLGESTGRVLVRNRATRQGIGLVDDGIGDQRPTARTAPGQCPRGSARNPNNNRLCAGSPATRVATTIRVGRRPIWICCKPRIADAPGITTGRTRPGWDSCKPASGRETTTETPARKGRPRRRTASRRAGRAGSGEVGLEAVIGLPYAGCAARRGKSGAVRGYDMPQDRFAFRTSKAKMLEAMVLAGQTLGNRGDAVSRSRSGHGQPGPGGDRRAGRDDAAGAPHRLPPDGCRSCRSAPWPARAIWFAGITLPLHRLARGIVGTAAPGRPGRNQPDRGTGLVYRSGGANPVVSPPGPISTMWSEGARGRWC